MYRDAWYANIIQHPDTDLKLRKQAFSCKMTELPGPCCKLQLLILRGEKAAFWKTCLKLCRVRLSTTRKGRTQKHNGERASEMYSPAPQSWSHFISRLSEMNKKKERKWGNIFSSASFLPHCLFLGISLCRRVMCLYILKLNSHKTVKAQLGTTVHKLKSFPRHAHFINTVWRKKERKTKPQESDLGVSLLFFLFLFLHISSSLFYNCRVQNCDTK